MMTPRTHIFAVAIENYQDKGIPSVDFAENDAREFVAAWQQLGVDANDCVVLLKRASNTRDIYLTPQNVPAEDSSW